MSTYLLFISEFYSFIHLESIDSNCDEPNLVSDFFVLVVSLVWSLFILNLSSSISAGNVPK